MWKIAVVSMILAGTALAQVTQRVSLGSSGEQGNDDCGGFLSISADGRYVAFGSNASNLVPGDVNVPSETDVFVRDRWTGNTEMASVTSSGEQGSGQSFLPSISADGRYVAFLSYFGNFSACPSPFQIIVRDRQAGTTEAVSVSSSGECANDDSWYPRISADGRYVVFYSFASNLVPGDVNGVGDVFVHDLQMHTTEIVSVSTGGTQGNATSSLCTISGDGRYVAFQSSASTLVPVDTNGKWDIFLRDRSLSTTALVSVDSSGIQANGDSEYPSISADGRHIAFPSHATNLVASGTTGEQFFVRDRQTESTELVSVSASGIEADRDGIFFPSISPSGRYVAFGSNAGNLDPSATDFQTNVFLRDRQNNTTELISRDTGGTEGNNYSEFPAMTPDGRWIAFLSRASNLVPGDTNFKNDIFLRDRNATAFTSLCTPNEDGVTACPCSNPAAAPDMGCDNSSGTGGAYLSAFGVAYLSSDSLVFSTSGEKTSATSVLLQGTTVVAHGSVYGQGVRCVGGTLKRLYTKTASSGSITVPDFGAGDPTISARSAAKGNVILAGQSRYYLVFYRDPIVLGGCPASSTFNCTQTGMVTWSP